MYIIHGDNLPESRNSYLKLIAKLKSNGYVPQHVAGEKISAKDLESQLLTSGLFENNALVIENLLSRKRSKEKEKCLSIIANYKGSKPIVTWDKKSLTNTILKKFTSQKPQVKEYKIPLTIFKFINVISPQSKKTSLTLLHRALKNSSDTFIFAMLARQVAQLLVAKSSPKDLQGAPWQKSQLQKLAGNWTLTQLTRTHSKLLNIDEAIKTGKTKLDLAAHLDLLILKL